MNNVIEKSQAKANIEAYFKTHDVKYISENAVFINMGTGERHQGREAIAGMLQYIYHVAFEAKATVSNTIITDDKALLEGFFIGKHIGSFAGIEPTRRDVNVPLCVVYSLEDGLISEARIYMQLNVLIEQLHG